MLFSAAPLRTLSATTQRFKPRGWEMSSRRAFSLHRRHCLRTLGGAAALLGLPSLPFGLAASAAQASRKYSKKVVDLVERSLVIDMLGPLKIDFRPEAYSEPLTEEQALALVKSGFTNLEGLRDADVQDLVDILGVDETKAREIHDAVHRQEVVH